MAFGVVAPRTGREKVLQDRVTPERAGPNMVGGRRKPIRPWCVLIGNPEHATTTVATGRPASNITDVLSQVERWTGFTRHFGHVSSGLPPTDERAFLATLIAEAT
ncbi:MAG: Tn3 family transposase, partial [Sphingobium sp.]